MSAPDVVSSPGNSVFVRVRCRHCDDVIGAYEPMVLEAPEGARETSLAAEPALFATDEPCFHRACYAEARAGGL